MWKSVKILSLLILTVGLLWMASPVTQAWDMSDVSLDITVYVTPLVAPTVTNDGGASSVGSLTARLNGEVTSTGNENPTVTLYLGTTDGGTDAGAWDDNVTLGIKTLGAFYYDATGLLPEQIYFYRYHGRNAGGEDWADTSANFTTIEQCEAPTGLTLTDLGYVTVTANWTPGMGTTYTMLRGLRSGYPTSITDGELIYYGDASSVNSTGFALDVSAYYVSAWGFLADNVTSSSSYATATIGGEGMTGISDALESLSAAFTTIGGYIEYGIGVFFILAVFSIAIWRRDLVTYMISGLIAFFVSLMWLDNYLVISLIIMFLAVYQWFEALVIALSSGGPSKGISQFKGVIDTVKGWFE